MKRKLLMTMVALLSIGGVKQSYAYTVSDLTSDGWTQITTISQSDITDKYYVFVANDANLMLGLATSSNQATTAAFYQAIANPALDAKKVWTLEANGGNYAMRNLYSNSRQMQTEYSSSSNDLRWRTNDQTGSISWTGLGLAYADGAWSLTSTQYNRPLGIYNNGTGTPTEGNEIGANDAGNGQKFQIYAIIRSAYWALASAQATQASPVTSFTGLISNQEIYNKTQTNLPTGWSEDTANRKTDNSNRTAGTGITRLEGWASTQWGGAGTLYVDYYQNLTSMPNGVYKLTALTGQDIYTSLDSEANGNGKIYISNGSDEQTANITTTTEDITTSTVICDGTLKIGMRADGKQAWVHAEDFRLTYIGKVIRQSATDLPANGDMVAGTWYKFTPAAGRYNLTTTTLGDIVYTTDGTILLEDEGDVTETFGANPVTFSATTYYIKSSSANNFAYEADSYDVTALVTAYNTAVTNAGTAKTNAEAADKVNAAEKTELDNAITTYGSVEIPVDQEHATKTQMEALETATAALTSATTTVNTSITAYANAKAYFDAVEPVLATTNFYTPTAYATNYSTPKAAYNAGTLSDDAAAALSYGSRRDGNMPAILLSSWAGTTLYINTWSTESEGVAPARDFANPFFEYWVADGNNLGANTFTSTIGGLTADALYAVTLNARVKQRDGNRKVAESITMKVGSGDAVDLTQGQHIAMSRRFIDSYTAYGYTDNEGNLVTTITVAENSNISWLAFRDMNYAHVEGASALDEVIAEVTDLNGHVPTNVYSTASAVVASHTGGSYPTTDAEFATAISDIRAAAATAAAYKSEYDAYLELKGYADALVAVTNDNAEANSTLATAISTAASSVNSVADVAALTSVNTTLKAAMVTYAGAANPVGDGKKFNLTFMLGKVNFDDCISWESPTVNGFSGWATEQDGGNFQVMENASTTSGIYHSFIEYWSAAPLANSQFNLYTTVEDLPKGTYTMSCYAFAGPNNYAGAAASSEVYFYANNTQGGKVSDSKLTQKEISFVNDSEQDVKIGLKPVTGNTWRWMGIGYVELYKVPEQVFEINEANEYDYSQEGAGRVVLTRTIKVGINTLVLPFSMTQGEVEAAFGEGSKVYVIASYDDTSENITFDTQDGITANKPCLLKATVAGTSYAFDGRTIVAAASVNPVTDSYNGLKMIGSYAAGTTKIPQGANNYVVSGGALYTVDTDVTIKNTRAYFSLTGGGAKSLKMTFAGTATEVIAPEVAEAEEEEEVLYNMAGIQVDKNFKGFVVNQKGEKRFNK